MTLHSGGHVLEIARFRADLTDEFLASRDAAMAAIANAFTGLVSQRLIKLDDGSLADELVWTSRDEALAAANAAPEIPAAAAYFGLIDEFVSMDHAEIVVA